MVKEILFYSCVSVGVVLGMCFLDKATELTRLSEVYCHQKYTYIVTIILSTGNHYYFQWHSNYLYKSVTDLLENASRRSGRELAFQYQGKEIVVNIKEIILKEMEIKQ